MCSPAVPHHLTEIDGTEHVGWERKFGVVYDILDIVLYDGDLWI